MYNPHLLLPQRFFFRAPCFKVLRSLTLCYGELAINIHRNHAIFFRHINFIFAQTNTTVIGVFIYFSFLSLQFSFLAISLISKKKKNVHTEKFVVHKYLKSL